MRPRVISDQGNRSAFFKCRRDVECWSSCSVEDVLAKRPREACSAINVHLKELWAHILVKHSGAPKYIVTEICIFFFPSGFIYFSVSVLLRRYQYPLTYPSVKFVGLGFFVLLSKSSLILCSLIVEVSCVTLLMNLYFADKWKCRVGFCVLLLFFVCFFLCAFFVFVFFPTLKQLDCLSVFLG